MCTLNNYATSIAYLSSIWSFQCKKNLYCSIYWKNERNFLWPSLICRFQEWIQAKMLVLRIDFLYIIDEIILLYLRKYNIYSFNAILHKIMNPLLVRFFFKISDVINCMKTMFKHGCFFLLFFKIHTYN